MPIQAALANDNFFGFALDIVYKYKVRYIECAAASPLFTALITYYVEGDKGHMLNVRQHKPQRAYACRGNVFSFHMPWEDIAKQLGAITAEETVEALPHDEQALSHMVLFSLRVGDVTDLNTWLPMARLRLHVVLQLLFALVDSGFVKLSSSRIVQQLKEKLQAQLAARYPEREEDKGEGRIPPAVEAAIKKAMRAVPGVKESGVLHKHATPAAAPDSLQAVINELRPSSV